MKSGHLANPVSISLIVCGKRGSAAMDPIIPTYSWDSDDETEHSTKTKNTKEQQLFLKTRNGNIRSNGKQITPRVEEGYCNEGTQSRPLTHSQTTKPRMQQNRGKTKKGLDKRGSGMMLKAFQIKYEATKILSTETDSKCRLCQQFHETIDHIISACPILAKEQYKERHDRV